jgi:CRP-like cAMP-binding protein
MPASYNRHWSIFKAWKDWKAACLSFADPDICSEDELERRAQYLGIPVAQLRWVSSYRPDPISLLERRMGALSLDPDEIAHMEPLTVRELRQAHDTVRSGAIRQLVELCLGSTPSVDLFGEFAARELDKAQEQLLLIGNGSAEEKVAMFLVNWRNRLARFSAFSETVPLPMRRQDIADFLGLKLETVSRTLAKLEQKNVIRLVPNGVFLTGLAQTLLMTGGSCQSQI